MAKSLIINCTKDVLVADTLKEIEEWLILLPKQINKNHLCDLITLWSHSRILAQKISRNITVICPKMGKLQIE